MVKNDKKENTDKKVKLIPLGGLEQIGMNMTAIEYEDSIIVMDCGLAFPSDDMLGIDLVIPDVTYLTDNIDKVKGFVITHGHEDHIGALPYVLKMVNAPVYGTKLTIGLIDHKLKENNMLKTVKRKVVKHGQSINLGCFRVEFIKMNHSIEDAAALAVFTAVFAYGDLMWPLIVNTDINMMTLSSGLATLRGQFSTNFPVMMAGSLLAMVPMVVLYLFFQKQFIEGVAMTGGK